MATICTLSGNVKDLLTNAGESTRVEIRMSKPLIISGEIFLPYTSEVEADSNGDFSIDAVETTTSSASVIVQIRSEEAGKLQYAEYSAVVPDSASADLADIIS